MENKGIILICDEPDQNLQKMQVALEAEGLSLEIINDAGDLVPRALRVRPVLIIVNPDMKAFNDYDVCKHLMKGQNIPVFLMVDKSSTTRAQVDECMVDEVITKPVEVRNLVFLVETHLAISH